MTEVFDRGSSMPLDEQLMDRLFDSPDLPSLPAIALQIIELVQEDEVDVDKIAEMISLDPALSSKMLKTVNSSFYGLPKTVGSVQQAVVVLGLNSVKTLALGFTLVSNLTDAGGDDFDPMSFWRRSLYGATAAKQLCEQLNIVQAEEVFMASLLQDVGVLALAQVLGGTYTPLMRRTADNHRKLGELERESLGGDHMEVGAALAESWGLPPLLVESIRLHEHPNDAPENLLGLIRTVGAGSLAADLIEDPDDEERVSAFFSCMEQWFELDGKQSEELIHSVFKHASEAQRLFELPTGELANPDVIMSKANEALRQIALEASQATNEREQATDEATLAQTPDESEPAPDVDAAGDQAVPDAVREIETGAEAKPDALESGDKLTGLQDRRQFEEQLDELFLQADVDQPISVLYIDIDSFKLINDRHGIHAGDAVLRGVAKLIDASLGSRGKAFRFDEDAFAALCPCLNRHDAALLAESLRSKVEAASFEVPGSGVQQPIALTASVGVATYDGELFKRSDQLLKAASKGVDAAKGNGCNLVRVFVPKTKGNANNEAA